MEFPVEPPGGPAGPQLLACPWRLWLSSSRMEQENLPDIQVPGDTNENPGQIMLKCLLAQQLVLSPQPSPSKGPLRFAFQNELFV